MPPRKARERLKRGTQSASARAWDRAVNHLTDVGAKIQRAAGDGHNCGLSEADVDGCVNDLSVIIQAADNDDDSNTPGVWAALTKCDGAAGLLALYGVAARCSCASLTPSIPDSLRLLHAKLRFKLTKEFSQIAHDVEERLSKRDARSLARGLLNTHLLRCYSSLMADATRPLMSHLQQQLQEQTVSAAAADPAARAQQQLNGMAPNRRLVKALSDVLGEAADVLRSLKDAAVHYDSVGLRNENISLRLVKELCASGFMDLFSRGVLLLAGCEGCGRAAASLLECFTTCLNALRGKFLDAGALLAASPSLSFLLSAHVAQLAAALDGGGACGLPSPVAPWAAPLMLRAADGAAGGGARQLDFAEGEAGCCVRLAALALVLWGAACRYERLGSTSPAFIFQPDDLRKAVGIELPLDCPPALEGPPRSIRQAAGAHLRQLEMTAAFVSYVRTAASSGPDELRAMTEEANVRARMDRVEAAARSEARRVRRLAAPAADAPPLNAIGTVHLCLRLTAVAWEVLASSGGGGAAAAGGGARRARVGQPGPSGQGALRLTRAAATDVALQALSCAKAACGFMAALATRTELPRPAAQQLEACWREWLAWAGLKAGSRGPAAQRALGDWEWSQLGEWLALDSANGNEELPAEPPVSVAAAIAAGYLPGLEWLLRQLRSPDQRGAFMMAAMMPTPADGFGSWQHLLAFAPRRDVVRFVDTLADLVLQTALDLPDESGATGAGRRPLDGRAVGAAESGSGGDCSFRGTSADPWDLAMNWVMALEPILMCCHFKPAPRVQPQQPQQRQEEPPQEQPREGQEQLEQRATVPMPGPSPSMPQAAATAAAAAVTAGQQHGVADVAEPAPQTAGGDDSDSISGGKNSSGGGDGDFEGSGQGFAAEGSMDGREAEPTAMTAAPEAAGGDGEVIPAGDAQLGEAMSYIAVRLLPAVSELLCRLAALCCSRSSTVDVPVLSRKLGVMVSWIKMLAAAECWADVLVCEIGVFGFLRAAIALRRTTGANFIMPIDVLDAVICLGLRLPQQTGEALRQGAAPPGPASLKGGCSDGGGGGADGGGGDGGGRHGGSLWEEVTWLLGSSEVADMMLLDVLKRLRDCAEASSEQPHQEGVRGWGGGGTPPLSKRPACYAEGVSRVWQERAELLISPAAARELQPDPLAPGIGIGLGPVPGPSPLL